jgi:hypothetical protein
MILSTADLIKLTDKVQKSAQARVLKHMGIPFKTRPDKSIVVFLADINAPAQTQPRTPSLRIPAAR